VCAPIQKIVTEARSVNADAASRISAILESLTRLEAGMISSDDQKAGVPAMSSTDKDTGLRMVPCLSRFFDPIPDEFQK